MTVSSAQRKAINDRLILFVTGDAPRSQRARGNLAAALSTAGLDDAWPREIDLLNDPGQAIAWGTFATPALLRTDDSGPTAVLYGDLSDEPGLSRFINELVQSTGAAGDQKPAAGD